MHKRIADTGPTTDHPRRRHHHGDLRAALVAAALEMLDEAPPRANASVLSLRRCAQRAGVSHAAPAYHFRSLAGLRLAVMARGHAMLATEMQRHLDRAVSDARARLEAVCEGYVAFARAHPALYRLMMTDSADAARGADAKSIAEIAHEGGRSFGLLQSACRPFRLPGRNARDLEVLLWSLLHGYVTLFGDQAGACLPFDGPVPEITALLPALEAVRNNR